MIIRLKQSYTDKRWKKPVVMLAGTVTANLPIEVMRHMVTMGHAEQVGDRLSGPERRAAASKPEPKTKPKAKKSKAKE
jgi:hypothetical protein